MHLHGMENFNFSLLCTDGRYFTKPNLCSSRRENIMHATVTLLNAGKFNVLKLIKQKKKKKNKQTPKKKNSEYLNKDFLKL